MKKNLFYVFALICSMSLFTACSDDDDVVILPIEQDMAGSYKGELEIAVNNTTVAPGIPQKVYISKSTAGDNQLRLELKKFSFGSLNLGDIQVDPCAVTELNGTYSFSGKQTLALAAPLGSCPVTVTGTIKGSAISINIGVEVDALKQEVVAKFDGTKLKGSESSAAAITGFTFDSEFVTEQPVINEENGTITFKISDTAVDDNLKELVPTITISEKATITPASGVAQDFSNGKSVTYTVIAEDGTSKVYVVSVAGKAAFYSFETWESKNNGAYDEPNGGWATSNTGVYMIVNVYPDVYSGDYAVLKTDDAKDGNTAVKLVTLDTKGQAGMEFFPGFAIPSIPKITSGSLFLGTFEIDIMNTLNSTKFGNPYFVKPLSVEFSYKYIPGEEYYLCPDPKKSEIANLAADKSDECSVTAILYEVPYFETEDPKDPNNASYDKRLTGSNLYTAADQIVAIGTFTSGLQADYKDVTIALDYKQTYDPSKKYRFSVIFSSSKDGDKFSGAPGSTLIVDAVKVVSE